MNDSLYAGIFIAIFALVLLIYGGILYATGDAELLPYRAQLSIDGPEDVKHVGMITARIGLIIGIIMAVVVITHLD